MNTSGQIFGREAIGEGYTHDSMGLPIDPNAIYNWKGLKWTEITELLQPGLRPKVRKPLVRK